MSEFCKRNNEKKIKISDIKAIYQAINKSKK